MDTRTRNRTLDEIDAELLEVIRGWQYSDGESEESQLLELVYAKIHNAIDTLKLPEGDRSGNTV
jgi:hypothetical protein